jgi:acyl carrier protein
MSDPAVREIIALIASELEIPESKVNAGSSMDTIPEWDSMAQMIICLAIQDRFGVTLDMESIENFTSVMALAKLVDGHHS